MNDVTTKLANEASDKAMEIARLKADNDRLREQSERLFDKTLELATENSKLRELCKLCEREAENAKLRECLQDLAEHIREDDGFGLDYGWMLDRMRELGIEVNA